MHDRYEKPRYAMHPISQRSQRAACLFSLSVERMNVPSVEQASGVPLCAAHTVVGTFSRSKARAVTNPDASNIGSHPAKPCRMTLNKGPEKSNLHPFRERGSQGTLHLHCHPLALAHPTRLSLPATLERNHKIARGFGVPRNDECGRENERSAWLVTENAIS